jgi:hypothetical protein
MCLKSTALPQNFMKIHIFTSNNGYALKNSKDVQQDDKGVLIRENAYKI